jgi:hypothetical protein
VRLVSGKAIHCRSTPGFVLEIDVSERVPIVGTGVGFFGDAGTKVVCVVNLLSRNPDTLGAEVKKT